MLTGKGLTYGGSLARKEATGFGLCYFTEEMLLHKGKSFKGATVVISGSGNVAIYAAQKATEYGAKVVAMSDSEGYIYDKKGIDLDLIKEIKEVKRARIKTYLEKHSDAVFTPGSAGIWTVKCDIALPCATQNELDETAAKTLVANGCMAVAEGANMPCTPGAVEVFQNAGVMFGPAKAANAGGVATSGLEMSQNSMRYSWTFEEVDAKLKQIMKNIYANAASAAEQYGMKDNLVAGANIAGFTGCRRNDGSGNCVIKINSIKLSGRINGTGSFSIVIYISMCHKPHIFRRNIQKQLLLFIFYLGHIKSKFILYIKLTLY